jgi:hypothetical protein
VLLRWDSGVMTAKKTEFEYSRRSWLMGHDTAGRLAEAVEDLHHETRLPKWQVTGAIVQAGLDHLDQARVLLARPAE